MGTYVVKLPDIGEGIAEAELVEWHVAVGDVVREDDVLAVVMTDKASVEVPSSVEGKVTVLGAEIGDHVSVGGELVRLEVAGDGNASASDDAAGVVETEDSTTNSEPDEERETPDAPRKISTEVTKSTPRAEPGVRSPPPRSSSTVTRAASEKPLAPPSVRKRAREAGVDLRQVMGSGPAGRITHEDFDRHLNSTPLGGRQSRPQPNDNIEEIKVVGLRRRIAEKMAIANAQIPHITIVEEVDVDNLEELRAELNANYAETRHKLTLLPFVMKAMIEAIAAQPAMNAHFDQDAGIISQFGGVHIGVAAQTPNGLMVPVVRHAEVKSLWESAAEIERLASGARDGSLGRDDLTGSTISLTSLGPLGAIATTPIINHPEVAIVGINKIAIRPVWDGQQFAPGRMMNISCSFDHRVIDGWDAAVFVQKLKTLLEKPAMLFVGQ